jgi:hypothetical protein
MAAEIAGLTSLEVAVEWARGSIAAKNTLTVEDAGAVETVFRNRMLVLQTGPESPAEGLVAAPSGTTSPRGSVAEFPFIGGITVGRARASKMHARTAITNVRRAQS